MPHTKVCEWCTVPFSAHSTKARFCCKKCSAAHTARVKALRTKKKTCPICGNQNYRQSDACAKCRHTKIEDEGLRFYKCPACGHQGYRKQEYCKMHGGYHQPWTDREDAIVSERYPSVGAAGLLGTLVGRTHTQIQNRAYHLGVVLLDSVFKENVHGAAAEYMRANNPSRQPGATERLSRATKNMWSSRPDIVEKLFKGHQQLQKSKPTKLEQKLFRILDDLGVEYVPYAIIKPKFIVDAQVGKIIIQADGEWWHGHPRFAPLNDRQIAQQRRDAAQDAYLKSCGFAVVRIWEREMRLDVVRDCLMHAGLPLCA